MKLKTKTPNTVFIYIFFIFLPLTYLYPRINSDDYGYAFNWNNENEYLETPSDFIESSVAHYMTRNGRIWGNGITAIFSANDFDIVFKIMNALFFTLFIFFTAKIAIKKEPITPSKIFILFSLIWFLNPVPGETWLWMCGALNYLWSAVFTMGFLLLLKRSVYGIKYKWFAFIFCIFCGWQHEAFSAPILGAGILYYLIKKPKLTQLTLLLWTGYFIGTLLIIFAPGSIHRADSSIFSTHSILLVILFRVYTLGMLFFGLKLKATIIAIAMLIYIKIKHKNEFKQFINDSLLLILTIGCGILFMTAICYVEERGLMPVELFSIILIYRSIYFLSTRQQISASKYRRWKNYVLAVLLSIFIYDYSMAVKAVYKIYEADKRIMSEYLASDDGIVCSPLKQKDYQSRFIIYCNEVGFQEDITKYYHYHTGVWKPFHLLPKPFYDAVKGDNSLFTPQYQVKDSKTFYQYGDEKYYVAKYDSNEGRKRVRRSYGFAPNGIVQKLTPQIAQIIERFYSNTNLQVTRLTKNGTCYVFVNKIKRMLPGLTLKELELKEVNKKVQSTHRVLTPKNPT